MPSDKVLLEENIPLGKPCEKCGWPEGVHVRAGPHIKLECASCGAYVKFVKQFREHKHILHGSQLEATLLPCKTPGEKTYYMGKTSKGIYFLFQNKNGALDLVFKGANNAKAHDSNND